MAPAASIGAIVPRLLERLAASRLGAVFISHGHPDHCADLNPRHQPPGRSHGGRYRIPRPDQRGDPRPVPRSQTNPPEPITQCWVARQPPNSSLPTLISAPSLNDRGLAPRISLLWAPWLPSGGQPLHRQTARGGDQHGAVRGIPGCAPGGRRAHDRPAPAGPGGHASRGS
jgi:hypothetical protein